MDRENAIKGLEVCRDQDNPPGYRFTSCVDDCPYHGNGCARKLKEDALELLKKQKAQKFFVDESGKITPLPVVVRCKDCRYGQYCTDGETTYQCFKWNSGEFGVLHEQNWFCADGQRSD